MLSSLVINKIKKGISIVFISFLINSLIAQKQDEKNGSVNVEPPEFFKEFITAAHPDSAVVVVYRGKGFDMFGLLVGYPIIVNGKQVCLLKRQKYFIMEKHPGLLEIGSVQRINFGGGSEYGPLSPKLIFMPFFAEAGKVYFIGSRVEVESVEYGLLGFFSASVFTLEFNQTINDPSVLSGKKTSHCAKKFIATIRNRPGRYKLILTNGREYKIQLVERNKKVILFYLEGTDPKDRKTVKMKTVKSLIKLPNN